MQIEQKKRRYEVGATLTQEVEDMLRNNPYEDLRMTVEPQTVCDYEVKFYLGDQLVDTVTRTASRKVEHFDIEGPLEPTQPNSNWVAQERGEYIPGKRAKVVITNNEAAQKVVFEVIFAAKIESFTFV